MGCSASIDSVAAKKSALCPPNQLAPSLSDMLPRGVCTSEAECTICANEMKGERVVVLPCFHQYHVECGLTWLARDAICPVCRLRVSVDTLDPLHIANLKEIVATQRCGAPEVVSPGRRRSGRASPAASPSRGVSPASRSRSPASRAGRSPGRTPPQEQTLLVATRTPARRHSMPVLRITAPAEAAASS